ncbi:MAG TPA: hypothetical protein VNL92_06970 [Dehalococcoidia bacterium]|nr:hypothetical protein [Dehalococcoidia bacterium]
MTPLVLVLLWSVPFAVLSLRCAQAGALPGARWFFIGLIIGPLGFLACRRTVANATVGRKGSRSHISRLSLPESRISLHGRVLPKSEFDELLRSLGF